MIEPVLEFNLEVAHGKFAELARVAGASSAEAFVPWLARLKQMIGIAPSLSAVGVKREQIRRLVDVAEKDICHKTNPRPCTRADFEQFFEQAM